MSTRICLVNYQVSPVAPEGRSDLVDLVVLRDLLIRFLLEILEVLLGPVDLQAP